jgi:hypothetical protein
MQQHCHRSIHTHRSALQNKTVVGPNEPRQVVDSSRCDSAKTILWKVFGDYKAFQFECAIW